MKISRFGILIAGFLLIIAIAVSFIYFRREQNVLRDDLNRRAHVIAKSPTPPAIRILKNPPSIDEEDVAERLQGLGRTLGLMICGPEGKLIARSSSLSDIVTCNEEVMATLASGKESFFLDETGGQLFHRLVFPLKDRSGSLVGPLTIVPHASYITKPALPPVPWVTNLMPRLA